LAVAGPEAARSAAPAHDGLPSQNRNNSTNSTGKIPHRYRYKPVIIEGPKGEKIKAWQDPSGRNWVDDGEGGKKCLGDLSSYEFKAAFAFKGNVAAFIAHYGRANCGLFTITQAKHEGYKAFNRRCNSYFTHEGSWCIDKIRVLEIQPMSKRAHNHYLVALKFDMWPDSFNWEAKKAADKAARNRDWGALKLHNAAYSGTAHPRLKALWHHNREKMKRYGLGRSELLPLRKTEKVVAAYLSKYLGKGCLYRREEFKGSRRVECSRGTRWKNHGVRVSWLAAGQLWRGVVAVVAKENGLDDLSQFKERFGKRWAWYLRKSVPYYVLQYPHLAELDAEATAREEDRFWDAWNREREQSETEGRDEGPIDLRSSYAREANFTA
jgi:hypothetical protein